MDENQTENAKQISNSEMLTDVNRVEERRNPFESCLLEMMHRSAFSPSVFAKVISPNKTDSPDSNNSASNNPVHGNFRWSIDHIAALNPAQIDEAEIVLQESCQRYDEETEARLQSAIDKFFSQPIIAPSPMTSGNGGSPIRQRAEHPLPLQSTLLRSQHKQQTHPNFYKFHQLQFTPSPLCNAEKRPKLELPVDVSCQTMLTLPPDFDLASILGSKFLIGDHSVQTCGNVTTGLSSGLELWNSSTQYSSDFMFPKSSKGHASKTSLDQGVASFSTLRRKLFGANTSSGSDESDKFSRHNSASSNEGSIIMNNTQNVEADLEAEFSNARLPDDDGDGSILLLSSSPFSTSKRSPPIFSTRTSSGGDRCGEFGNANRTSFDMRRLSSPEISPIKGTTSAHNH